MLNLLKLHRGWLLPIIVLAVGLISTAAVTYELLRQIRAEQEQSFAQAAQLKLDAVNDRLRNHIALLRGAAGLFVASEHVTREEFKRYVERLSLRKFYPGVQGIGFSRRIPAEEMDQALAEARDATVPDFAIWPAGSRPEYHTILYLEPLDRRNLAALGYDMYSEPVRRAAMAAARDEGRAAASGKVELVQEIDEVKQAGFLIYVPVYLGGETPATLEERRANLLGFAYSPYRAGDLLSAVAGARDPALHFAVYDGPPEAANLLYRSEPEALAADPPKFTMTAPLDVAGREWTLSFAWRPASPNGSEYDFVPFTIGFGLLGTALLFGLAFAQMRAMQTVEAARERAELLMREVNHRVANSLALVASLARLQMNALQNERARGALEEMLGRITAIGDIHRRLYTSPDVRFIEMDAYLVKLAEQLESAMTAEQRRHKITVEAEPIRVPTDKAVSLGVIVTELVMNALKYAYPHGIAGDIRVRLGREREKVTLVVEDDGVGLGAANAAPQGTGLGARIVQAMAASLNAETETDPAHLGTRVKVSFVL